MRWNVSLIEKAPSAIEGGLSHARIGGRSAVTRPSWTRNGHLLGWQPEQMTRDHFLKNKLAMAFAAAPAVIGADPASGTVHSLRSDGAFPARRQDLSVPADQWKPVYSVHTGSAKPNTTKSSPWAGCTILGTERHEAARIETSCAAAAGRQGDPAPRVFSFHLKTT